MAQKVGGPPNPSSATPWWRRRRRCGGTPAALGANPPSSFLSTTAGLSPSANPVEGTHAEGSGGGARAAPAAGAAGEECHRRAEITPAAAEDKETADPVDVLLQLAVALLEGAVVDGDVEEVAAADGGRGEGEEEVARLALLQQLGVLLGEQAG